MAGALEVRILLRALDLDMATAWREATVNVYLAFRAALLAVRRHNASSGYIIRSLLAPAFGTGVGGMNYARAARQMAAAYRVVVLGEQRHLTDARAVWRHHHELLR